MDILDENTTIFNCSVILLVHLILQMAEKRTTHSWGLSIFNSLAEIQKINQENQVTGTNLSKQQLLETLESAYNVALENAVTEAWGGIYKPEQLNSMIDRAQVIQDAIEMILQE
jgi:hypothetical protein